MTDGSLLARARRRVPAPVKHVIGRHVLDRLTAHRPLVPAAELTASYVEALRTLLDDPPEGGLGDYVEFGVYRGTSMACMAQASRDCGLGQMRLIGFDSFEGLPVTVEGDDGGLWKRGQFRATEKAARRNLDRRGVEPHRVTLVKGWFDDTATPEQARRLGIERVSIAMLDCDAYSSTRTALAFLSPLLADRAVLFFDDWHSNDLAAAGEGEYRAFQEFLASRPDVAVVRSLTPYATNAEVVLVERTSQPAAGESGLS